MFWEAVFCYYFLAYCSHLIYVLDPKYRKNGQLQNGFMPATIIMVRSQKKPVSLSNDNDNVKKQLVYEQNNSSRSTSLLPSQPFLGSSRNAVGGEERCVTTLTTAAKETTALQVHGAF